MLKDNIKAQVVEAVKNRDSKKADALRYLLSLLDKREMQLPSGKMDQAEEMNVLKKELKNKEESRAMFDKAGRSDLVAEVDFEIGLIKQYIPEDMSEEDVKKVVEEVVAEKGKGVNNFGIVMREVMIRVKGKTSGEVVSRIVKEELSK
jgi:uncharacterized protein YqeY